MKEIGPGGWGTSLLPLLFDQPMAWAVGLLGLHIEIDEIEIDALVIEILVFVNNQQHKNGRSFNTHWTYLKLQLSQNVEERNS